MAASWWSAALMVMLLCGTARADTSNKCAASSSSAGDCIEKCPNPHPDFPNLNFGKFREQPWFHQINLSFPGLQLVNEEPYLFVVNNFLSPEECALLRSKAKANLKSDSFTQKADDGTIKPGKRTSSFSIARNDEVPSIIERTTSLANLHPTQLQALKLSQYKPGGVITFHSDAHPGALPRTMKLGTDSINDGGRALHGVKGDSRPGMNRFVTVLTYLNTVEQGGRTRFKWTCYDKSHGDQAKCTGFYKHPTPTHGKLQPNGAGKAFDVSFPAREGMAIIFFPSTTAATGGVTDYNTVHEGEAPEGQEKYVIQSFTWSLPHGNMSKLLGHWLLPPKKPLTDTVV